MPPLNDIPEELWDDHKRAQEKKANMEKEHENKNEDDAVYNNDTGKPKSGQIENADV